MSPIVSPGRIIDGYQLRSRAYLTEKKTQNKTCDLTGRRFGCLFVEQHVGTTLAGYHVWGCLCSCGKRIGVLSRDLSSGMGNCGCARPRQRAISIKNPALQQLPPALRIVFKTYYSGARARRLSFRISPDEFWRLTQMPCHYCGRTGVNKASAGGSGRESYAYNGIDRIKNDVGYVPNNCRSCCKHCNRMKSAYTQAEFQELVKAIATHWLGAKFGEEG